MLKRAMGGTPIVRWLPFRLVCTAQTKAVDINEPRKHCWHVWSVTNKEWVKCTPHLWAFTLPLLAFQPRQCAHPDYVSLWKRYQKVKRQKAQLLTKQSFKVKLYLFPLTIVYLNLTHTESEEVCFVHICRVLSWNSRTNATLFSMEFETGFSKI